jgi:hypothetical protein
MRNFFKKIGAAVAGLVGLVAGSAHAAIPAAATTAMSELTADATTIMDWMWGVAILVTFGFILLKLVKKGGNKAT